MAFVGLDFGEKVEVAGKKYRTLNEGLVDAKEIFGQFNFRGILEQDNVYVDDTTQARRQDGTYPQIPSGEVRGTYVALYSPVQNETIKVLVVDKYEHELEELGIKYREDVEVEGLVVAYNMVRDNQISLFIENYKKAGNQNQKQNQPKQEQHKEHHG